MEPVMFPESLVATVPVPWLVTETPPSEIDACRWAAGAVCRLAFCPDLGVVTGFLSFVGPVLVALAGTSSLPLLNSPSDILCNLSFAQPARFVAKPCAEIVSLTSSSIVVSFSCFHPSASSWRSSKRWSHLSFLLAPASIFEILNFGIVIVNNAVLLHFVKTSEKYINRGMYLYFLWVLRSRLVDHILFRFNLPVTRLGHSCIRLALTFSALGKNFLRLYIGPCLRVFLVKWIASNWLLCGFNINMMLCLATKDFADFDITQFLLINRCQRDMVTWLHRWTHTSKSHATESNLSSYFLNFPISRTT